MTPYSYDGEQPLCENALSTTHLERSAYFSNVIRGIVFERVDKAGRPIVTFDPQRGGLL